MKTSDRSLRLASEIEEALALILMKYTDPETMGFVTIAGVEISGDISVCDVFLRAFGENPELAAIAFNGKAKKIAHEMAQKVKTRRVLQFRFKIDKSAKFMKKY